MMFIIVDRNLLNILSTNISQSFREERREKGTFSNWFASSVHPQGICSGLGCLDYGSSNHIWPQGLVTENHQGEQHSSNGLPDYITAGSSSFGC